MYLCSACEYRSTMKLGKCPNCGEFGSFIKDLSHGSKSKVQQSHIIKAGSVLQPNVETTATSERTLDLPEFARVFDGKMVQGGIYLLGGAPGIGKSTAIVQLIDNLMSHNIDIQSAYFSGEEQTSDIAQRRERLIQKKPDTDLYQTGRLEDVIETIKVKQYNFVVIDSIQTIYSDHLESFAGSVQQVRYCADQLSRFGKQHGCTMVIIGHVTKGGDIAGPKYLEHIVDVVLNMEGDRLSETRFLRSYKNRFGHTADVGIFEMTATGLQPVNDLTERILKNAFVNQPGTVLTIGLDNGRPVMVVVEVLLSKIYGKYPTTTCVGVDSKRVEMVSAIAKKYCGLNLENMDVYVNIPGEFKLYDSGIDLAILVAMVSHYYQKTFPAHQVFVGEITLSGKVTKASAHSKRLQGIPDGFDCVDYKSLSSVHEVG